MSEAGAMIIVFYLSAAVAVLATLAVITRRNAVHALLYLIVSLLAVAVIFFILGAPFVAALEVIIYAGAIMVLFVFVVMMLGGVPAGPKAGGQRRGLPGWSGPAGLSLVLLVEFVTVLVSGGSHTFAAELHSAAGGRVGTLFDLSPRRRAGRVVLLAGAVGAYHIGRRGEEAGMRPRGRESNA